VARRLAYPKRRRRSSAGRNGYNAWQKISRGLSAAARKWRNGLASQLSISWAAKYGEMSLPSAASAHAAAFENIGIGGGGAAASSAAAKYWLRLAASISALRGEAGG